jgi:hypothetical protein
MLPALFDLKSSVEGNLEEDNKVDFTAMGADQCWKPLFVILEAVRSC